MYLDFTKAFDKVNNPYILVAKLAGYVIGGWLLQCLASYLKGHWLIFKCECVFSSIYRLLLCSSHLY